MNIDNYKGEIHSPQHQQAIEYALEGMEVGPCGQPREETVIIKGKEKKRRIYYQDGDEGVPEVEHLNGKAPLPIDGHTSFTSDRDWIERQWRRWPEANIGWNPPPGIIVIDLDPSDKPEEDGLRKWEDLIADQEVPVTTTVRTGRGGMHLWFKEPVDLGRRPKNHVGGKGIDVRCNGRNVILPGSTHENGKDYVFEHRLPFAQLPVLPEFLIDHVYHPETVSRQPSLNTRPATAGSQRAKQYAEKALRQACEEVGRAPEGTRNSTLNKQAYSIGGLVKGGYLDDSSAWEQLQTHALTTGLPEHEIDKTLTSAFNSAEPRTLHLDQGLSRPAEEGVGNSRDVPQSSFPPEERGVSEGYGSEEQGQGSSQEGADMASHASTLHEYRERRIQEKVIELEIFEEAKRRVSSSAIDDLLERLQSTVALQDFLSRPTESTEWLIEGLQPMNTRVLLAAQAKAGKTTLVANLIKALADEETFLDHYPTRFHGTVTLIDNEMNDAMLQRWLKRLNIRNPESVRIVTLRGHEADFNILNEQVRKRWAEILRGTDYLILDCLRPIMDALALDENREAGTFLSAFGQLLYDAEIDNSLLIHHMGHNGDRARGDSRITDWPDATWKLMIANQAGHRSLSAIGRDVEEVGVMLQKSANGALRVPPEMSSQSQNFEGADSKEIGAADWVLEILAREDEGRAKSWLTRTKWSQAKGQGHPVPKKKDIEPAVESLLAAGHLLEESVSGGTRYRINKEERVS